MHPMSSLVSVPDSRDIILIHMKRLFCNKTLCLSHLNTNLFLKWNCFCLPCYMFLWNVRWQNCANMCWKQIFYSFYSHFSTEFNKELWTYCVSEQKIGRHNFRANEAKYVDSYFIWTCIWSLLLFGRHYLYF